MSNKIWLIRRYEFDYNGECYAAYGSCDFAEFKNKEEAEVAYRKFEISKARKFSLSDMEFPMYTSEEHLLALDDFVYLKCGRHILNEHGSLINEPLPKELSDEDTFTFVNMANSQAAQLLELDEREANKKYWVVFFPFKRNYLNREWVSGVQMHSKLALVSAETKAYIKKVFCSEWRGDGQIFGVNIDVIKSIEYLRFRGSLEKLSQQPLLLNHLVEKYPDYLKYENNVLRVRVCNCDAFWAVNEQLKKPFIEFCALNDAEIKDLGAIAVD